MLTSRRWASVSTVAVLATVGALTLTASPAQASTVSATSAIFPPLEYVGDSAGKVFSLSVTNTGTRGADSITIGVPSPGWKALSCPAGPAGWSRTLSGTTCVYKSAAGTAGDLAPGKTTNVQIKAGTLASTKDFVGRWSVSIKTASPVVSATATGDTLSSRAYSVELTRVVAQGPIRLIGYSCPDPARSAQAGSTTTLVVCGINHTTATVAFSSTTGLLQGTFATPGTLHTGSFPKSTASVVVGDWADAHVTTSAGTGKTVQTRLSSSAGQSTPAVTFPSFTATDRPPVAAAVSKTTDEDTAAPVTLQAADPDGDSSAFAIVSAPTHGTLSSIAAPACVGTAPKTCTASVTYTPAANYHGSDSFTYKATDPFGQSSTATASLTVNSVDDAPTDLALTPSTVAENKPAGTTVGTLSTTDADAGDSFTYSLVTGAGDDDNVSFGISGSTLTTAAVLDFETHPTYHVRVRTMDAAGAPFDKALTITVTNANDAPTDLALSPSTVPENQPVGTTVGTLSSTDPDSGDSFLYTKVTGTGDDDNGSFTLSGATLKTNAVFDEETKSSYTVRVRTTDAGGLFFEKALTITVANANDAPTSIALSKSDVDENLPAGTTVGTLSGVDPDSDPLTFTIDAGPDAGAFTISGTSLKTAALFDKETKGSYTITVRASDGNGGELTKQFTITVNDVNDAPTDIGLSATSVPENSAAGTTVGGLTATDQDTTDTFTYSLVPGTGSDDNASFAISGGNLVTNAVFDYETKNAYTVRVSVSDGHGGTFEKAFALSVSNVDEAPTDLALTPSSVPENQPSGTTVGALSTTDPDLGDSFTYALVGGTGSADNASFAVSGGNLVTTATFDKETKSSYTVRVQTTDSGSLSFAKALTITVGDANDPPTDIALSASSIDENSAVGSTIGTVSATDEDATDTLTFSLVSGTGSTDNASFTLSGTTLQTATPLDYETKSSYSIRIQVSDGHGGSIEKAFTLTVNNVNESPTGLSLTPSTIAESASIGSTVGTLTDVDPDTSDTASYALVAGAGGTDNATFTIVGDTLQTSAALDFETHPSYSVRVQVTDGGSNTFATPVTITVTDVNEAPTDIALSSSSIVEGKAAGTTIGTLSTTDPEGGSFTYALVTGTGSTDNALFQLSGNALQAATTTALGTYSVRIRSTDGGSLFVEKAFTITVTPSNAAPTDIALSNSSVDENAPSGTTVGTLSDTDADAGDSPTYSITGGADAAKFSITGSTLQTAAVLDFEAQPTYAISIKVDDGHSGTFTKGFTISANDKNDPPTDLALSSTHVNENQPSGTTVGTFSTTDQDVPANTFTYTFAGGADDASFTIAGSSLKTAAGFDFETKASYAIKVQVSDGAGGTLTKAFTITVDDVNEAPTAGPLTLSGASSAVGNTPLVINDPTDGAPTVTAAHKSVTADLLSLASDPDSGASLSVVPGTVVTALGGSAVIESDGDVTYTPKTGACSLAQDSFTYSVTDGSLTGSNTVKIDQLPCIWYVDPSAGVNGDGSAAKPFNTLGGLNGAGGSGDSDVAGDTIFVYPGNATGGLPLEANEKVLGNRFGLTVPDGGGAAGTTTLVPATGAGGSASVLKGGIVLSTGNTLDGVDIGDSGSASVASLSGSSVGTAKVDQTIAGTISNAAGPAILIAGTSNVLAFDLASVSSAGSTSNAVSVAGASGTVTIAAGALSNATSADVAITTSTMTFTSAATINDASGQLVAVSSNAGGTTSFTGAITGPAGTQGISLTSNPGSVSFSGGLSVSSGANAAFTASGGGSVSVSGTNTLTTTTGTAVTISGGTTINGSATFQSISSNGAANAIVLNGTGAGTFSVTGTGTTAGSGGTIQGTTSDAIALTSTGAVSLANLNVQTSQESGILGSAVNGLNLTGDSFTNNGNDSGDCGIKVTNLTGTATWSNLSVTGSALANVLLDNSSGTLTSLNVTGASHFDGLGTTFGGNSVLVDVHGTATLAAASIDGATFSNNKPARGITVQAQESGTITGFVVKNSAFINNGLHASFEQSGNANLTFSLLSNGSAAAPMTMPNTTTGTSHAVNVFSSSSSTGGTIKGRIQGNYIGSSAVTGSGSADGDGIRAFLQGKTLSTLLIDSNTIRQVPLGRGIDVEVVGPTASGGLAGNNDITVTNNDVNPQDTDGFPLSAIYVAADNQGTGTVTTRADIRGNTVPGGAAQDSLPTFLALDQVVPGAICQLVDSPPASADPTAQLTSTNTGSASAAGGCTLIAGPLSTPP